MASHLSRHQNPTWNYSNKDHWSPGKDRMGGSHLLYLYGTGCLTLLEDRQAHPVALEISILLSLQKDFFTSWSRELPCSSFPSCWSHQYWAKSTQWLVCDAEINHEHVVEEVEALYSVLEEVPQLFYLSWSMPKYVLSSTSPLKPHPFGSKFPIYPA